MQQPITFIRKRAQPWWRRAELLPLCVSGSVAALLGFAVYTRGPEAGSQPEATAALHNADDAVTKALSAGKPTVIEFGANNCVSCREMKPVLHALAQDVRIVVADVDILKERGYISRYQIKLMPTQVFYDPKGRETGRHMGKISGEEILARLGIAGPVSAGQP
jgi:thioredoxin 1